MKPVNEDALNHIYEHICAVYLSQRTISSIEKPLHQLAEAQYAPVLPLLEQLLDHDEWDIRLEAVRLVGFHYETLDHQIVQKLQSMLLTDPEPMVRLTLATVLGMHVSWPNESLCRALTRDSDSDVRLASFEAMLYLHAVPRSKVISLVDTLKSNIHLLNIQDLQRLLNESGIASAFLCDCLENEPT